MLLDLFAGVVGLGWLVACLVSGFVGWDYVVSFVLFCSCGAWCCGGCLCLE